MPTIDSRTRLLAVLGDPVAHSLSPTMHNAAFSVLGINAAYLALHVVPSALSHVLRGFEATGVGGNITVPHKVAAARLVVKRTDLAEDLGAVNTFWLEGDRLMGDNTDVAGVRYAVDRIDGTGPWLVAGTGGSARAVAAAARELGVRVLVRSRSPARAREFVAWASALGTEAAVDDGSSVETVINATPLGLGDDEPSPVPAERLDGARAALDLVYRTGLTAWCRSLRAAGLRVADGRAMLVGQGAEAFRRWFPESDPPVEVMAGAVNGALRT